MAESETLITLKFSDEAMKLVRKFAFDNGIASSREAVRELLRRSPDLQDAAKTSDLSRIFPVVRWGRFAEEEGSAES